MVARAAHVVVLGATGELGARVVRLLRAAAPDVPCVRASRRGRDGTRALDVRDPPPAGLIAPGDVVIDVVGPYTHDPSVWVGACSQAGAHYIDLSERPDFIARVEAAGAASPCAVLSGCSTVPALASSLLAEMIARAPAGDVTTHVEVFLSMGTRHRPSPGLMHSLLRPLGRPLPGAPSLKAFRARTARTLGNGARRLYGRFPCADLGLGCPARFWSGFDRAPLVWALSAASLLLPLLSDRTLVWLCRPLAALGALLGPLGSEPGSLRLERHRAGEAADVVEIHAPTRGLDVPALPAVWAATRLVGVEQAKVRSLSDVVSAEQQRAALTGAGYRVVAPPSRHGALGS